MSSETTVELAVSGMTCASCVARVERKLNRIPGVEATVNLATETAHVSYPTDVPESALIAAVEAAGYHAHVPPAVADAEPGADSGEDASLRLRTIVAATLSVPVAAFSMLSALQFSGWQWLVAFLATPVVTWCAWPLHSAAASAARHRTTTMDTLVSLGILVSYGYSMWALLSGDADSSDMPMGTSGGAHLYFEVAAVLTTFILLGRTLETRARHRSGAALRALLELAPRHANVLRDGREHPVAVADLTVGDLFVTRPGEQIATDGLVVDGMSALDVSMLTGESVPVEVGPGDAVTGGTIAAGGRVTVRATRVGADTRLAQITALVVAAQAGKAPVQRLADRVSAVFVPIVLLLAAATLAGWLATGHSTADAITGAVSVLVVACPCALGLATPTALLVGTGRGAQLGILITGPEVLESTRRVDTVVLDKTGTVTTGQMRVVRVVAATGERVDDVLSIAGSVEHASEHPIAQAIVRAAESAGELRPVTDFMATGGLGAHGRVDGRTAHVGRLRWLAEELHMTVPEGLAPAAGDAFTSVAVGWDGTVRGIVLLADTVRASSPAAVAGFVRLGLHPYLLTGDRREAALVVADAVGIPSENVVAGVLPEDKVEVVRGLSASGRTVAMVGDGVNDAAALATAQLGIAMGTGTDAAIQAADITLVRADLLSGVDAVRLARRTLRTIRGNLVWAFGYNTLAIPLAVVGLASPMLAAAAMAFSSVFVVSNSLRLRRFQPLSETEQR